MNLEDDLKIHAQLEAQRIPQSTKDTIDNYVLHGLRAGHFVEAVLSNDLKQAFGRADVHNLSNMFAVVKYVYNEIPATCHGSPETVKRWYEYHRNKNKDG